jgi:hypothetical protein
MKRYKYEVSFDAAASYDWFYTRVYAVDEEDNKKLLRVKSCCRNHKRAAKWARKIILNHEAAKAIVWGAVK